MRFIFIILGIISTILALVLSILPFGTIAFVPIVSALIFSLIAFKISKKEGKSSSLIKILLVFVIIALGLTIYNISKPNIVNDEIESISKENQTTEDSIEELESIDIEE